MSSIVSVSALRNRATDRDPPFHTDGAMDSIHSDLLSSVVRLLPLPSLAACRSVSKWWCRVLTSDRFCRLYYRDHAPSEMRIVDPPAGMTWRDVLGRLPLLFRAAPALLECCRRWPQLVAEQETTIQIQEVGDEDVDCLQIFPQLDSLSRFEVERVVVGDTVKVETFTYASTDFYALLFYVLLDGGRCMGLTPLGVSRPLACIWISSAAMMLANEPNEFPLN